MSGHVSAMSRNRVLGKAVLLRDVAIRSAAPQIGFDIVPLGVAADAAGPSHAITVPLSKRAELGGGAHSRYWGFLSRAGGIPGTFFASSGSLTYFGATTLTGGVAPPFPFACVGALS